MIIKPRVKDYLCLTAHPEGCKKNVEDQIAYVKAQGEIPGDAKKVLVIGCSTGYGLASRIVAAFGCHADTLGIMFERPSNGRKTASPGWYNTASFEQFANEEGVYAKTINGDAFSKEIKNLTIETIKKRSWKSGPGCIQPCSTTKNNTRWSDISFCIKDNRGGVYK